MTQIKTKTDPATEPQPEPGQPEPGGPDPDGPRPGPGDQTPAEAADAEGSGDIARRIERQLTQHQKALERILDMPLAGHACTHCGGMGFTQEPEPELVKDPTKQVCPGCNGYGQVRTPSLEPKYATAVCVTCSGQGWVNKPQQAPAPVPATPPASGATGGMVGQVLPGGMFLPFGSDTPIPLSQLAGS